MKVALRCGRDVFLRDITLPPLKEGQIRLKVEACGICGTDIHCSMENEQQFGHEIAGKILEISPGVSKLVVGQKIVLDSATPCGRCDNCKNAENELCSDIQSIWYVPSFGFAEEMIAPAISATQYENITPEVASLQEPLGVAIDLVRLAEINMNSNVLIIGQGTIGLMATALAKRSGARRIFVAESKSRAKRVELAERFGADICFDPLETPLESMDFGCEINRILVTAPPKVLTTAFKIAGKGAIISFIGIAFGESADVTFNANEFHFKKLQLRGSFASPALFGPMALRYLTEGVVDGKALITHRYGLDRLQEALRVSKEESTSVKVVIVGEQAGK
jgi:threonine dehydrogenase-like Zn-dependent dehydrogenase